MDNHEELLRKYELSKSPEYKEIKQRVLDYLIGLSSSQISPEKIQGALLALRYVDSWATEYYAALAQRKEEGN